MNTSADLALNHCAYLRMLPMPALPDVELWWVDLDAYAAKVTLDGLSADEQVSASSRTFETDARRFLASHHARRKLLGGRLRASPELLIFGADEAGKPTLLDHPELHFNSSRSGAEALIGICADRPVGVDIEVVRRISDADALAHLHFTAAERSAWLKEAADQAHRVFLTCWTRKEACVKALGVGLRLPLESIEAGCETDLRRVAMRHENQPYEAEVVSLPSPGRSVISIAQLKTNRV